MEMGLCLWEFLGVGVAVKMNMWEEEWHVLHSWKNKMP